MKVLLFSRDFSPSVGGIQTIVAELARGLAEPGNSTGDRPVDLTVVTSTPNSGNDDKQFSFPVIRQPNLRTLARLIRRADVVHLAGPGMAPLVLSFLCRKPVVVEHHGFQVICPNGQMLYQPTESTCPGHFMAGHVGECLRCNRKSSGLLGGTRMLLLTPLRRWLCNRARVNITPTHWLASQLKLKRQRVVLHGIQPNSIPADSYASSASRCTFAYQGRLVSTKGIRVLLKAFEQLCDEGRSPRLIIVGGGPEEKSLRSAMARFGGMVEFRGEVPGSRLDATLADVATVIMPSLAGEVFGLVAAENMMRGKLLIVSDLGSLQEVVGDAALIFPAGDAAALADCMRIAMDDASRARNLARLARARAESIFSSVRMIQEHVSIYQEALAGNQEAKGPNS